MKKSFKSVFMAVLAVALCASMVGCGNKKSKDIDNMTEKDAEKSMENFDKKYGENDDSSKAKKEKIDPFENLSVTFVGTSPNSSVEISGGNDSVTYSPDIKSGMKNGDVVTITAETDYSNISLKENKKQYTVDGLSAYAMKLEEIPDDMKEKMQKQANDAIKASTASWHQGVSLKQLDFVGYYFLTSKDGFNQTPYNQLYCVYKGTANVTGLKRDGDGKTQETGEETFYTYYTYSDIMLLNDNKCSVDLSSGQMASNTFESDYGYYNLIPVFYTYDGYKDLDSMFSNCVTQMIGSYNYESTVK
ncbi:MAG: hypothetical protein LKG21_06095 [Ruminococcus sp.]|jgi:hypothetical protein|nr:hypothetical protein [Ruminococcus sp.]